MSRLVYIVNMFPCLHVSLSVSLTIYPSLCLDCLIMMTEKIGKTEFSPGWNVHYSGCALMDFSVI